jgi:hypothetical protein
MKLARCLMLLLLVFSGTVVWKTLTSTPAFNPSLVSDTIIGEGRLFNSHFMYDLGEYEYQRGFGYLATTEKTPGYRNTAEDIASPAALRYRAYKAVDALEKAVSLDPGNARAWVALAWARASVDDLPGSTDALRISWEIAPNNRTLALRRLNLFGILMASSPDPMDLTRQDRAAILQDAEVLELFEPRGLETLQGQYPAMFQVGDDRVSN